MSWLSGFTFRKSITVSRPSGSITNYQLAVIVGESSGSPGAQVHCTGNCAADFGDLRFTRVDGTTSLNYWIETASGTSPNRIATVWVKFDSINTTDTTFYIYYGNAAATTTANGTDTFLTFDDFERSTEGSAVGGAWTQIAGSAVITTLQQFGGTRSAKLTNAGGTCRISLPLSPSPTCAIRLRAFRASAESFEVRHGNGDANAWVYSNGLNLLVYRNATATEVSTGITVASNAWVLIELTNFNFTTKTYDIWYNGTNVKTGAQMVTPDNNATNTVQVKGYYNSSNTHIDDFVIRNWVATEPIISAFGAQEDNISGFVTDGGGVVGGTLELRRGRVFSMSGGLLFSSTFTIQKGYGIQTVGNVVAGGSSPVSLLSADGRALTRAFNAYGFVRTKITKAFTKTEV